MTRVPSEPRGIVLVLHGGRDRSRLPVQRTQLAVLRMVPIAARIARTAGRDLVVARELFSVRGWNGTDASPVDDVRWAVATLRERFPARPVCLVGHSMGGRAAMRAAGEEGVRSVVGLAPWLPLGEPTAQLAGRRVLIVHGSADRMTDPDGSAAFARSLAGVAVSVSYVRVPGGEHTMLRRRGVWEGLAAGFAARSLLGADDDLAVERADAQSDSRAIANLVHKAVAGEPWLVA